MADLKITLDKLNDRDQIARDKYASSGGVRPKTTRSIAVEQGDIENAFDFNMISGSEALLSRRVQVRPSDLAAVYEKILSTSSAKLFQEEGINPSNILPPGTDINALMQGAILNSSESLASVIAIAEAEVGTKEGPGEDENPYAPEIGRPQGARWSMTFIAWVFKEAGVSDPVISSGNATEAYGSAKNVARLSKDVRIGDVVFFKYDDKEASHAELVISMTSGGFVSVGGNIGPNGLPTASGGHGVYRVSHSVAESNLIGAYHPAYPVTTTEALAGGGATAANGATGASGALNGVEISGFGNPLDMIYVTSAYRTSKRPQHKGLDLRAAVGTPVFASKAGKVVKAATGTGYGYVVYIDHGSIQTRYAHLSEFKVSNGDQVTKGQLIGLSGGTKGAVGAGSSEAPHLHFEIRVGSGSNSAGQNTTPVNPSTYIPG